MNQTEEENMKTNHHTWRDSEGDSIFTYEWRPETDAAKAVVQIAHGMAETAERYERLAQALTEQGYIVVANDHRGHGKTAGSTEKIGIFGADSFNRMVENMAELTDRIRFAHSGLPIFLLGHSMGSFFTQQYMYRFPKKVSGVILSGSNGKQGSLLGIGVKIATLAAKLRGDHHRSKLLNHLTFGAYNKAFRPTRTKLDWLTRDTAEVDAYIQNPYCGAVFSAGFFRDFFKGLQEVHLEENMQKIPKNLPIYVFSGEMDPVGGMGKGVRQLLRMYHELGLTQVSSTLYPEGRHEMLNEQNRDEVTKDLITWLEMRLLV
jgi:alpha-beta hydrolase superfamily lysophospholipase